jgi:tetratricopeptide (TPR) repeat protein
MASKQSVWQWLSNSKNQKTLAWLGGGLAVVISGAWQGYLHFSEKSKDHPSPSVFADHGGIASGHDTNISGQVIANSPGASITIGITLAEYETGLKRREQEVRAELAQANAADKDKDKIAILEKQLADIQGKLQNPDKALEEYKAKLADAYKAFDDLKKEVLPEQIKQAQEQLTQGKTGEAEKAFQHVLNTGTENAAQAAYQLGKLAEDRIEYGAAERYYRRAVELQPENALYLNQAGVFIGLRMTHYAEAEPLMRQALAIGEASYGKDHPNVATALNNLAQLLQGTNRLSEAEPLMKRALETFEKSLGRSHPNTVTVRQNLVVLYRQEGKVKAAEALEEVRKGG